MGRKPGLKPRPAPELDPAGEPWRARADELAAWLLANLVVNRWALGMHRRDGQRRTTSARKNRGGGVLDLPRLVKHCRGAKPWHVIGAHAIVREGGRCWCRWLAIDIDRHDEADDPEATWRAARAWYDALTALGFRPLLVDSNGDGGYHIWILLVDAIPSEVAYRLVRWLVRDWAAHGLPDEPECYPKQRTIARDGFGNWLRLIGRHHKRDHWARIWDGSGWLEGAEAVSYVLATSGTPSFMFPDEAFGHEATPARSTRKASAATSTARTDERVRNEDPAEPALPRVDRSPLLIRGGDLKQLRDEMIDRFPVTGPRQRNDRLKRVVASLARRCYRPDIVVGVTFEWWKYYYLARVGMQQAPGHEEIEATLRSLLANPGFEFRSADGPGRHRERRRGIERPGDLAQLIAGVVGGPVFARRGGGRSDHKSLAYGSPKVRKSSGEIRAVYVESIWVMTTDKIRAGEPLPLEWTDEHLRETAADLYEGHAWFKHDTDTCRLRKLFVSTPYGPATEYELLYELTKGRRKDGLAIPSRYRATGLVGLLTPEDAHALRLMEAAASGALTHATRQTIMSSS